MADGRAAFNRGEYYEAHEFWEAVWDELDDPERSWVQGMIQIATGLHKLLGGRADVCLRLLGSGLGKLTGAPDVLWGVAAGTLRADAEAVVAALTAGRAAPALRPI